MHAAPVADHHTRESPLLAQNGVQQLFVFRTPAAVHLVVGSHQAPGISLADSHLEGAQVDFVHSAIGDAHIHKPAVVLLIVQGVVLQAHSRSVVLRTACVGHRQLSAEQRVLAQVFIGTPACGNALNVDGRTEYHVFAAQSCLTAHAPSVGIRPFRAPRCSKCRTRREERRRVGGQVGGIPRVRLHLFANAERSVGIFYIGDSQSGDTCRGEHVLAMQHVDFLLERHATDDLIDLCLVLQQLCGVALRRSRQRYNGQSCNDDNLRILFYHNNKL